MSFTVITGKSVKNNLLANLLSDKKQLVSRYKIVSSMIKTF